MLEAAFLLLMNSLLPMLRVAAGESFPRPLSREEERECLARMIAGDTAARDRLVEHNLRLVAHICKKYYAQAEEMDDLISIGTIGLIKGVNSYRPDKNVRLTTYASRCIENEILMHLRSKRRSPGELSLSEALDGDGEGDGLSIQDLIAGEEDMTERLEDRELRMQLRRLVESSLSPRESKVIRLRYGIGGGRPLTQQETASLCHISRSYVYRRA